jgi:Icc-related predicted phosphoesterase
MKIVCISDTHNEHRRVTIPPCDLLIHAGDMTSRGGEKHYRSVANWLSTQPATHKVLIAGNHDFKAHEFAEIFKDRGIHFLHDSGVTLEGIRIYGSPWTPWFRDWEYNLPRNDDSASIAKWAEIPDDTQILVTHGPPFGKLDANFAGERVGCPFLAERIQSLPDLRLHVFGHVHEGYGMLPYGSPVYVNAAMPKVIDGKHHFKGDVNQPVVLEDLP